MIVVKTDGYVIGHGVNIERVDAQDEVNLIKVVVDPNIEFGFYYIGTEDRDDYTILDLDVPDSTKQWSYIDEVFVEIVVEELPSPHPY